MILSMTFDKVWHEGLWQVLRSFSTEEGLVHRIQALYSTVSSDILLNIQTGEFFRATVGILQACLLSPVLFNFFPKDIMRETLLDFNNIISEMKGN